MFCPCSGESRYESAVAEPARARWRCGFKRRCPCMAATYRSLRLDVAMTLLHQKALFAQHTISPSNHAYLTVAYGVAVFFRFSRVWLAARANAVGRATQVPSPSRDATLPALSRFLRGFLKCCAYVQHQEGLMQIACGTQDRRAIKPLTRRSPVFCGFWRLRGEGHLPRRSTDAG